MAGEPLVLGVDPAWTPSGTWGLALLADGIVAAVARSCRELLAVLRSGRGPAWEDSPPVGGDLEAVLAALGPRLAVVSLDLPLAPEGVRGRRPVDAAVAREWGRFGAAVHSPTADRPGEVAAGLFRALAGSGYRWAGPGVSAADLPVFLETYPHPAIIELLGLAYRLPYKVARRHRYWPGSPPAERWERLAAAMDRLRQGLVEVIGGVNERVPSARGLLAGPGRHRRAKGLEDVLDALVCAWVGRLFLRGRCRCLGDGQGAIWLPLKASATPG